MSGGRRVDGCKGGVDVVVGGGGGFLCWGVGEMS